MKIDFIIAMRKRPPKLTMPQWAMVDAKTGKIISKAFSKPLNIKKKKR